MSGAENITNERNYLKIHDTIRNQQTVDGRTFFENVFRGLSTLLLRLDSPSDEPSDHIEFSPVDPRRMDVVIIRVAFVSTNQIEQMDLTELHTLTTWPQMIRWSTHRAGMQAPLVFRNAILYARCDLMAWNNRSQDWYDL